MDNKNYSNDQEEDFNDDFNGQDDNPFEKDEDFGLSEAAYDPIDRDDQDQVYDYNFENNESGDDEEEEESSNRPLKFILFFLVFAVIAGGVYFFFFRNTEPQPILKAEVEIEPEVEVEPVWDEPVEEPVVETALSMGIVTRLTQRTGRSHVIIGSFFDEDNIVDYSNKMAKEGVNCTIIPPTERSRFYRLAVQDFDTYSEALVYAEELKNKFTSEVWVLKY